MIWLLMMTEAWSADMPDVGYTIPVCEGEYPNKTKNVEELLRQEDGLQLCRSFHTVNEAKRFVTDHGLRLLGPIPSP
jgi:hypothetical protein